MKGSPRAREMCRRASNLMKSELVELSAVRKELKIEIPAETVQAAYQRIAQDYTRNATLPGFRQGRAPQSVVRRRYKSEIASDTLRDVIPKAVEAAIAEHDLQPLGEPEVHLENAEGLADLGSATVTLHAHLEVMPEVTLGQYKGLTGVRRRRPSDDSDIDGIIDEWREEEAALTPITGRNAQNGDTASVTLTGHFVNDDGEDFELDTVDIQLGHEDTLPEFSAVLQDAQPGDTRTCTVSYPEDFSTEELAGKTIEYTLTVNEIYSRQLPEVNDEWAVSLDKDYESVDDMRAKLRASMEASLQEESDMRLRAELFNQLIEAHEFAVPNILVQIQADQMLQNAVQDLARRGLDPRQLKAEFWRNYRTTLLGSAEREVRGMLLLNAVAEAESFLVTPDEIEAEIRQTAEKVDLPLEEVRAALTKDNGEHSIAERLRNQKALDLLVAEGNITNGEWIDPQEQMMAEMAKMKAEAEATEAVQADAGETAAPDDNTEATPDETAAAAPQDA